MWRYGLRGQLILNLSLVMLLFLFFLGLFSFRVGEAVFFSDRVRTIRVSSELIRLKIQQKLKQRRSPLRRIGLQDFFRQRSKTLPQPRALFVLYAGQVAYRHGRVPWSRERSLQTWISAEGNATWKRTKENKLSLYEGMIVLREKNRAVGGVWIQWSLRKVSREFLSSQAFILLNFFLLCVALLFVVIYFLERRLVNPLARLGSEFQRLASGDKGHELSRELHRKDEIGDLARAFLHMETILDFQQGERERYIDELKGTNDMLERAQNELVVREKMSTIGRMSAGIAHEVGNPLSAIIGYSDLLKEAEEWGALEQELVSHIGRETRRIDRLIRDLLGFARPVQSTEPSFPNEAVLEALEFVRLQARFKGMQVELELDDTLDLVPLSQSHLVQVLINLLLNAADACERQGTISIFSFWEDAERTRMLIEVVDDGPGVAEEICPRLFEPFATTKDPGKGVGLGLAFSHRLVASVGGVLQLGPEQDEGTCFQIILPLAEEEGEE